MEFTQTIKIRFMIKIENLEYANGDRFIVEFPKEIDINIGNITKITNPKFINGKWVDITIEFVEFFKNSTNLYSMVDFLNNTNKLHIDGYLFLLKINYLDAKGVIRDTMNVYVEEVLEVDFGRLSIENNDFLKQKIILKPLKCERG